MSKQPSQLTEANRRKTERARKRVIDAVSEIESEGSRVSVRAAAKRAKVSRNFVYSHPDLLEFVKSQPEPYEKIQSASVRQRSTEESLRSRLVTAQEYIKQLKDELADEQKRNARLLGELRDARSTD